MTDNGIEERSEMAQWKAKGPTNTETGQSMKESGRTDNARDTGSRRTKEATGIRASGRTTLKMEKGA